MKTNKYFNSVVVFLCLVLVSQTLGQNTSNSFQESTIENEDDIKKAIRFQLTQKNYEKVLEIIDQHVVSTDNKDQSYMLTHLQLKAYCLMMLNKSDEAEEYLDEICQKFPNVKSLYYYKSCVECFNDNYGKAIQSLTKEISIMLDHKEQNEDEYDFLFWAYSMRAFVYACRELKKEAQNDLQELEKLLQQHPEYPKPYYALALYIVPFYLNDTTDTARIFRARDIEDILPHVTLSPGDISIPAPQMYWRVNIEGKTQELMELWEKDVESSQNQVEALMRKRSPNYFDANRPEDGRPFPIESKIPYDGYAEITLEGSNRSYQTLVQAIQDKHYEQAQNALEDYMKCQSIVDYSENLGYFAMLCCIHFHFDHQDEVHHLMEQYYAKKKDDDPMFMYFFSLLNTHFGNYEKAIDDMTNAIVTIEKEPQKFLSKYKTPNISDQTALNSMLGQCYATRAGLYAVVKNIANARTDMKKVVDTFPEMHDDISVALFYKKLDKMEQSSNSISLIVEKKQSFKYIVIINNIINADPKVDLRWDEKLPDIPSLEKMDIPLFVPPIQTPSLPVAPVTPQFEIPVVTH